MVYVRILFMAEGSESWCVCLRQEDVVGGRVVGLSVVKKKRPWAAMRLKEDKNLSPCG